MTVLTILAASTLTTLAHAATTAVPPTVDCSKAAQGLVSIVASSTGDQLPLALDQAAKLAFACLKEKNTHVAASLKTALNKAKQATAYPERCGEPGDLQVIEMSSWIGGRPHFSTGDDGKVTGQTDANATYLVRAPFTCDGVGSGLYAGIISAASATLKISANNSFSQDDDSAPYVQKIIVQLK